MFAAFCRILEMNITADTKIIPIFGNPISHSLSPLIQNTWLKEEKINCVYVAFRVENKDLKKAIDAVRIFSMPGANVTVPHKTAIMKYLDEIDKSAVKIGSINTIVNRNGKLTGYNTDWNGFFEDLKENKINIKNKTAVVVGAGGGSKAVLYALSYGGIKKIIIASKTYKTAKVISKKYKTAQAVEIDKMNGFDFSNADIIINASTCGMNPSDILPFKITNFKKTLAIYDLIYGKETPFKKFASANNLKYVSGLGMLVRQGAFGFKMWTGKKPDIKIASELIKK